MESLFNQQFNIFLAEQTENPETPVSIGGESPKLPAKQDTSIAPVKETPGNGPSPNVAVDPEPEVEVSNPDERINKVLQIMLDENNKAENSLNESNVDKVLEIMLSLNIDKEKENKINQILKYMLDLNNGGTDSKIDWLRLGRNLLDHIHKGAKLWTGQAGNGTDILIQAFNTAMEKRKLNAMHGIVDYLKADNPMLHIKQNSVITNVLKHLKAGELESEGDSENEV